MLDTSKILTKVTYNNTEFTMKGSGESSKFAELVDGSITSVDEIDLARVETIKSYAFGGCQNLASVKIPSNVKTIGDGAFEACANLQTLSLAEGIEKIGATAFAGINAPINLPSTLTEVGNSAFAGNQALTSITIPSGLTVLSADMFAFCQNLTDVTMLATTPPIVGVDAFPENVVRIYVPYSAYDDYISSSYWTAYTSKIVRLPAKPSTITVTVNNYLGEMVSGASVTITGNNQTYTGTTDSFGVFSQGDLQPATYTISVADLEGFKTPSASEVVVEEDTQNSVIVTYLEPQKGISDLTFNEINAISSVISANNMTSSQVKDTYGWNVGDIITYTDNNGQKIEARILGYNHNNKSDGSGKAGITFGMVHCLPSDFTITSNTFGGTNAYYLLTTSVWESIPTELKEVIKEVSVNATGANFDMKLFIHSVIEVFGSGNISSIQKGSNEGTQYEYWATHNTKEDQIKCYDSDGDGVYETPTQWSLRSQNTSAQNTFVFTDGGYGSGGRNVRARLSYVFCI